MQDWREARLGAGSFPEKVCSTPAAFWDRSEEVWPAPALGTGAPREKNTACSSAPAASD